MKYLQMHFENWCLINVWSIAFCQMYSKYTFLIKYFDFIVVFSDMKFWEPFLHKNASDWKTCVDA